MKPILILLATALVLMMSSCSDNQIVKEYQFDDGFVRFNYDETQTKTMGKVMGKMKVIVFKEWVEVQYFERASNELKGTWVIPRDRIVYIGKEMEKQSY